MGYTKNQHMLSQWVLRNFRSDDTALSHKDKQRVWCHVVVPERDGDNDIKDIPLPISSVAICKDCFRLQDGDTGEIFDIEHELSDYEKETASLVRDLVLNHNFARLANAGSQDFPVESLASFSTFQMILNLNNAQSRFPGKDQLYRSLVEPVRNNLAHYVAAILSLSESHPDLASENIYRKLLRVAKSPSGDEEKASALFILLSLLALQKKPTLIETLPQFRDDLFSGIFSIDVFHTGHDLNSTEPRPVFTIAPNICCHMIEEQAIYLPLSHNIALRFSRNGLPGFYSPPGSGYSAPLRTRSVSRTPRE